MSSAPAGEAAGARGWTAVFVRLLAGLANVAGQHAELVRTEMAVDLRLAERRMAGLCIGLLVALAGLLLGATAVSLFIGQWLGSPAWGFVLVSLILLAAGLPLLILSWTRLRRAAYMVETRRELGESKRWLQEDILQNFQSRSGA